MIYKILRDEAPIYLNNKFMLGNDGVYNLRGSNATKTKNQFLEEKLQVSGAKLWNSLPLDTKLQKYKKHHNSTLYI